MADVDLSKWLPIVAAIVGSGGLTFGATSTADRAEIIEAAKAEIRAEMDLEQCERDKSWWQARAEEIGGGIN